VNPIAKPPSIAIISKNVGGIKLENITKKTKIKNPIVNPVILNVPAKVKIANIAIGAKYVASPAIKLIKIF
jgi:hypothetical protein